MALKRKLTAEEYNKLPKDIQKEYWKQGDDYNLDVEAGEGDDDPAALRRGRDREKAEAKRLKKELEDANKRIEALEDGDDGEGDGDGESDPPPARNRSQNRRRARDVGTIDAAWKERMDKEKSAAQEKQDKLRARIKDGLIDGTANAMASRISTMPTLMAEQLKKRLSVDFDDEDEPTLVILGKDGKPSSMKPEQLEREYVANKEFAAIIIGSKASGGGAPRNGSEEKPGGAGASEQPKTVDLSKLSGKELAAHLKAQKESSEAQ